MQKLLVGSEKENYLVNCVGRVPKIEYHRFIAAIFCQNCFRPVGFDVTCYRFHYCIAGPDFYKSFKVRDLKSGFKTRPRQLQHKEIEKSISFENLPSEKFWQKFWE